MSNVALLVKWVVIAFVIIFVIKTFSEFSKTFSKQMSKSGISVKTTNRDQQPTGQFGVILKGKIPSSKQKPTQR